MKRFFIVLLVFVFAVTAVYSMGSKESKQKHKKEIERQGISGKVEIWEGNFMPMTDKNSINHKITLGAGRKVRAYEPIMVKGGFAKAKYDSVTVPMIAETVCDSLGKFFLEVPVGSYSVLVEESNGWYANGWNADGIQGAAVVDSNKTTEILIKITSKATF